MFRPWKVFLSVAVGVAALPCSAMAQATPTITSPLVGQTIAQGQVVNAAYTCPEGTAECVGEISNAGPIANGAPIPTTTVGPATLTVTAKDVQGATVSTATRNYNIVVADDGGSTGQVPATLNLTLGAPTAFAPFVPGLAQTYTATLAGQILSTALDATLTVADPDSANTGRMVNGAYTLTEPVQVGAVRGGSTAQPTMAPLGGTASPTTLVTYSEPLNEGVTITFKQTIAATEALRTGAYSKTLTFTLSTTNP